MRAPVSFILALGAWILPARAVPPPLYTYTVSQDGTAASYDLALAASTIQGVINRVSPEVYLLSSKSGRPQYWLDVMSREGRWLEGRQQLQVADLSGLVRLAGSRLRGAVIWDPAVPATVNVATMLAGVLDGVVLSPDLAAQELAGWRLPVLKDLRGMFTGSETGSAKNDAYRWAIREYLEKGACSAGLLCLFEDSFSAREKGDLSYVVTRDWAVKNRAFVLDLSPWGDERPQDDPGQRLGLDLETYRMILAETRRHSAGKRMTELSGFFAFSKYSNMPGHKSAHDPVPTEWETVYVATPYNVYQNTVTSYCFNQSLHSQAPRAPLHQRHAARSIPLEDKTYVCFLMADYDSGTPLYDFLPDHWKDPRRGTLPLAWGIDPTLLDTYPDLIAYYYATATPMDTFTSDASAAGYMNPNRVPAEEMPLFVRHNQRYFREADMTIAPMVLDWDQPTARVKDAFSEFSPDGFGTIVMDLHGGGGKLPSPQEWRGMPVLELESDVASGVFEGVETTADKLAAAFSKRRVGTPAFHLVRIVWIDPSNVADSVAALKARHPELNLEVLDPYTFLALYKRALPRLAVHGTP